MVLERGRALLVICMLCCAAGLVSAMTRNELLQKINTTRTAMRRDTKVLADSLDAFWVIFAAILVFFMQAGFVLIESGTIRKKNVMNIIFKNIADVSVATIMFFLCGYGFAFGNDSDGFIGTDKFWFDHGTEKVPYGHILFQFAFASTSATIVSGSLAERTTLLAYGLWSLCSTSFVYPVVAHWIWGGGILQKYGMIDFAGGCVVHVVGGTAGLVGARLVGPRVGRYKGSYFRVNVNSNDYQPGSMLSTVLGTFIMWFGWYGFNAGSTLAFHGEAVNVAGLAAVNTTLSPALSALTYFIMSYTMYLLVPGGTSLDLATLINCVLGGLVAITPCCGLIPPSAACAVGVLACLVYLISSKVLEQLHVDDPLNAAPIHLACGALGTLSVGLFGDQELAKKAGYTLASEQLILQFAGLGLVVLWTAVMAGVVFGGCMALNVLRVPLPMEQKGLDEMLHTRKQKPGHTHLSPVTPRGTHLRMAPMTPRHMQVSAAITPHGRNLREHVAQERKRMEQSKKVSITSVSYDDA